MPDINKKELQEWLGLTRADGCVYLALIACGSIFIGQDWRGDALISLTAIGLGIIACIWGMKSDPDLEDITMIFKAIAYPLALLLIVAIIAVHYVLVFTGHEDLAGHGYAHTAQRIENFVRLMIE